MATKRIGVAVSGLDAPATLAQIERLERMGVPAAWLTTGGARPDGLTLFAAVAARTQRIALGTSIVPIFPRHPIAMAQQAQVVAQLAPGRFRLGVGSSHRGAVEASFGVDFTSPLGHLREYVNILKALLQKGAVDFDGQFYRAHARVEQPLDVPVMVSALRPGAFRLAGQVADGAISWVTPGAYLRDVALPAMREGAHQAGRETPPLVAHAPVCVHTNAGEVVAAAREQLGNYPKLPFYAGMFEAAGYPEARKGMWTEAMVDAVVLWGDEVRVGARLRELLAWGATEVIVTPVLVGPDRQAALDRTLRAVADAAQKA